MCAVVREQDPAKKGFNGTKGDNDPLDVMEIGSKPFKVGEVRAVKVLGDLELIDQGELDHKIIVIDATDPLASKLTSASDLKTVMPGVLEKLIEWLKFYKTTDGKAVNALSSDVPKTAGGFFSVTIAPDEHKLRGCLDVSIAETPRRRVSEGRRLIRQLGAEHDVASAGAEHRT